MGFQVIPKSMTLNGVMTIILHYIAAFGSFRGPLRKSGCLMFSHRINIFSPEKCHKVYTNLVRRTRCAFRGSASSCN